MPLPLVLGVCENDLARDLTFLKAFAGNRVDIHLTPLRARVAGQKAARILREQHDGFVASGFKVAAFLFHHDADRRGLHARRADLRNLYSRTGLGSLGIPTVETTSTPS